MFIDNLQINPNNRRRCKACGLYLNQLPVLDEWKSSSVFWVGLSSVLISDKDKRAPLSPYTKSGALLKNIEEEFINDISFYKTNLVKCLPLSHDKIRYPSQMEVEKCYPNLYDEIDTLKPKIIFLLGKQVAKFVLGKNSIVTFTLNDDFNYNSFVINGISYVPVHHPSYILVYKRKHTESYINGIKSFFHEILTPINN
jgi:DNA polymerase